MCGSAVLGTGAFPSPVRAITRRVVPVYDYVLATEPLDDDQLAAIGWRGRQGISDAANQFHYYRLTADRRIVWGGYDAVFHNWGRIDPSLDQRPETHRKLAEHFFETFPQLEGLRFTHRWGGVIDTSTRFSVGFGTAFDGRVAYAVGYTGPRCRRDPVRRPGVRRPAAPTRLRAAGAATWFASGCCRSRPSRCGPAASSSPAVRSPGPMPREGAGGRGSDCSTCSGSVSTAEGVAP